MARGTDPYRLSSPHLFVVRMALFLILVGFLGIILYKPIVRFFTANPGLNGLIVLVAVLGVVISFRNVVRLFREASWLNRFRVGQAGLTRAPPLVSPLVALMRDAPEETVMSAVTMRTVLDTVGSRLDEAREIARYLTGLLVFLGLLGTFWGLLQTVSSVSGAINALDFGSKDPGTLFQDLKAGLTAPLAGMGTAFSSSLFGLTGSLVLGFLDLQAGQAQSRFFTELENWLTTMTDLEVEDYRNGGADTQTIVEALEQLRQTVEETGQIAQSRAAIKGLTNLSEGIQGLVKHLRAEQNLMRQWADSQAQQNERIEALLVRLNAALDQDEQRTPQV